MFEDVVYKSEIAVCEAMENCLNKAEQIIEYAGIGEASDEYVMELFDIFMEATDRRKKADEIDEYMRKHNWGDVNANSSAKKKKAHQIRNFLIMQDFDPKTETIKSSDGKRRIKFNMNGLSNKFTSGPNKSISADSLHSGSNINKYLNYSINHEKGHEQFLADGRAAKWNDTNTPEDKSERGIKHIDETKAAGKIVGLHDDGRYLTNFKKQSPEELEADLHAAKNARVRTKYAGRKRAVKRSGATRNFTDKEIDKKYERMQTVIDLMGEMYSYEEQDLVDEKSKYETLTRIKETINSIQPLFDSVSYTQKDDQYIITCNSKLIKNLSTMREFIITNKTDFMNKTNLHAYNNMLESVKTDCDRIKEIKKILMDIKSDPDCEYDVSSYLSEIEWYENQLKNHKETLSKILSENPNIGKDMSYIYNICNALQMLYMTFKSGQNVSNTNNTTTISTNEFNAKTIKHDIVNISDKLKHRKYSMIDNYLKLNKENYDIIAKGKTFKHRFQRMQRLTYPYRSKELDDSTQMRHDFVKKYVHEYFIEFMEDYFSYENVFLCDD